ncbi:hypothetical protein [Nonomuraea typhae]|uniref:Bacterial spore germination immunoglobulin-like domain-containing protein n=1 Tax=Nonomuraea typhae TaxID=2603600 RepID=A0ABW7Z918_9ACTN
MNLRVILCLVVLAAGCGATAPPAATATPETLIEGAYQPLWPFASLREAREWQERDRPQGHQPWHEDAPFTALSFAQGYLGLQEIDQVVSTRIQGRHARVTVGYRSPESKRPAPAAVIHLVRYGPGENAPWEVVGTDDTTLTLTTPRYGSAVRSPVTVGGRITGVDESIRVRVHQPSAAEPLAETPGVPAGGENQPWSAEVAFTAKPGEVVTIVAVTGGHVAGVERFAVTGVTSGP